MLAIMNNRQVSNMELQQYQIGHWQVNFKRPLRFISSTGRVQKDQVISIRGRILTSPKDSMI